LRLITAPIASAPHSFSLMATSPAGVGKTALSVPGCEHATCCLHPPFVAGAYRSPALGRGPPSAVSNGRDQDARVVRPHFQRRLGSTFRSAILLLRYCGDSKSIPWGPLERHHCRFKSLHCRLIVFGIKQMPVAIERHGYRGMPHDRLDPFWRPTKRLDEQASSGMS
jgi:hypothetical protein